MSKGTPGYLGRYRMLNVVNTGQTCQMWQAYHDGDNRFVAIKTLLDKFRKDREHVSYLKWEYTVGITLKDDRVIKVEEYGVDRGTPYLAMEWFAAPNMKNMIRLGIDKIAHLQSKIALESAEALAYFSEQGWVHRDIKPDNFLVTEDGQVKLIDFALARRRKGVLGRIFSVKSKIQGTRSYMSPEQIRGEPLDDRADLYSLACTLFELLSGKLPFTGTSAADLLNKHLKASAPTLESVNNNVTSEVSQLLRRSMAKKPAGRPESVQDFCAELKELTIFRSDPTPPKKEDTPH